MTVIKLDVDGVIRNTFWMMCDLYNKHFGTSMTVDDIHSYEVNDSFPLIREKLGMDAAKWFFDEHGVDCFFVAPAFKGVSEVVKELRKQGNKIVICTHQPLYSGRKYTLKFLAINDIEYDELHFTQEKWAVLGDVIIDDAPDFLMNAREKCRKICIDYPFNRHITEFSFDKGNRYKTTTEALKTFLRKETR